MQTMKINDCDNVAVVTDGKVALNPQELKSLTDQKIIPGGHKVALKDIKKGENVIKYGYPIGHATKNIKKGEWVHTHNVKTNLDSVLEYQYNPHEAAQYIPPYVGKMDDVKTFMGYKRKNGDVGIRRDLYIVPTVGCINNTTQRIKDLFIQEHPEGLDIFDNITVIKHPYGCSQLGQDHANTRDFLADVVLHPNAAAVLVVGLGCENNTIDVFKDTLQKGARGNCGSLLNSSQIDGIDQSRIKFLIAQEVDDEIREGANILADLLEVVKDDKREELPISALRIGLKCGGSDGFSGISANPLLGKLSDWLTQNGGTTVLTEVPEMFGAETILMNRCINESVFNKTVSLINNFKQYFIDHNEVVYENPSPGNKAGGITTLEDKSLGCTQKAGLAKVVDVLDYAQKIKTPGLNLLQSPGNDLVAASALGVAGCHLVLFTTGRGNPYGTFVPTVKVSSNNHLYNKKSNWIDFNAGRLLNESYDDVVPDFVEHIMNIINGDKATNERGGYREVAIFKTGITL